MLARDEGFRALCDKIFNQLTEDAVGQMRGAVSRGNLAEAAQWEGRIASLEEFWSKFESVAAQYKPPPGS